ncbi:MAG: hypothetical protein LBQ24_04445 [Candidatus Peribacteria bacterium]|jgi:hypothetical protein|nr:hypothetical protein [Candidatus Peribacteria bacterium]
MKNIIKTLFLFLLFIAISEVTLADSEEDECFKLLDKAVENDVRFKNSSTLEKGNLTQVLYNETTSSKIDLNKYEEFKKYTSKNPAYTDTRRNSGLNNKDFLLRR